VSPGLGVAVAVRAAGDRRDAVCDGAGHALGNADARAAVGVRGAFVCRALVGGKSKRAATVRRNGTKEALRGCGAIGTCAARVRALRVACRRRHGLDLANAIATRRKGDATREVSADTN
jgi:hypothetical protein